MYNYDKKSENKKPYNKYKSINKIEKKLSIVIILLIICIFALAFLFYDLYFDSIFSKRVSDPIKENTNEQEETYVLDSFGRQRNPKQYKTLEEAVQNSNKTNILFIGLNRKGNAHVITILSEDTNTKYADILSFSKDTYCNNFSLEETTLKDIYKQNNPKALIQVVKEITNIPINGYVEITYNGSKEILNSLNKLGIELNTNINNFDEIEVQHQFIQEVFKKIKPKNLPLIIETVYSSTKTNIGLAKFTKLAMTAINTEIDNIAISNIIGNKITINEKTVLSLDKEKLKKIIKEMYNVKS